MTQLLSTAKTAALLDMTEAALRQAVQRKSVHIPRPIKMGRNLRWKLSDIEAHIDSLSQVKKAVGRPRKGQW